jgi:hypothetical protein
VLRERIRLDQVKMARLSFKALPHIYLETHPGPIASSTSQHVAAVAEKKEEYNNSSPEKK